MLNCRTLVRKAPSFSLIKTFVDFSPQNECYGDIKIVLVNALRVHLLVAGFKNFAKAWLSNAVPVLPRFEHTFLFELCLSNGLWSVSWIQFSAWDLFTGRLKDGRSHCELCSNKEINNRYLCERKTHAYENELEATSVNLHMLYCM